MNYYYIAFILLPHTFKFKCLFNLFCLCKAEWAISHDWEQVDTFNKCVRVVAGESDTGAAVNLELLQSLRATEELINKLSSEHKDLHGNVSKVGKDIDKVWCSL